VLVSTGRRVGCGVGLGVRVGTAVKVGLGVRVGVRLGARVGLTVAVGVRVEVGLGVRVGVQVGLGVGLGVALGRTVCVGCAPPDIASVALAGVWIVPPVEAAAAVRSGLGVMSSACGGPGRERKTKNSTMARMAPPARMPAISFGDRPRSAGAAGGETAVSSSPVSSPLATL
jgi:hypothetical protein